MLVCPICETAQRAGEACDVCGRPFGAAPPEAAPVTPLPDLEPTGHGPTSGAAEAPLVELEPTGHPPAGAVSPEPLELEPTRAEAVPDDRDPAAAVVCRYCRAAAAAGEILCARCGMRLPVAAVRAAAAPRGVTRCAGCGVPVTGPKCPSCGSRVAEA